MVLGKQLLEQFQLLLIWVWTAKASVFCISEKQHLHNSTELEEDAGSGPGERRNPVCVLSRVCLWPHGLYPARLLCPWDVPGTHAEILTLSICQAKPFLEAVGRQHFPTSPPKLTRSVTFQMWETLCCQEKMMLSKPRCIQQICSWRVIMKRVFVNGIILACIMETHSTKEPHGESLYKMKGKICYANSYLLISLF